MPFPVAHSLAGISITLTAKIDRRRSFYSEILLAAFLSNLPDFDFLLVLVTGSLACHRSFSHSLLAALLVGSLTAFIRNGSFHKKDSLVYTLVYFSHIFLDFILSTRNGVQMFWPLSKLKITAGVITYPLYNWLDYDGFTLIERLAFISLLEIFFFSPVLFVVFIARRYLSDSNVVDQ
ncbi:MAG: metal-dependent hydrolase [Blastocatellia bacterium]|nr:metal-dependent hydrolase [Blastocatellia bacterium]